MHPSLPPDKPRVLVVDDERLIREILADFLVMEGFEVTTAEDGQVALQELATRNYDLVLSDLKMPRMGGLELLREVSRTYPEIVCVIMTGFGTVETAIDAMKRGAYDYVLKPFKAEEIVHVVQRGLEKKRLAQENVRLRNALSLYSVTEAINASLSLDQVVGTVESAALLELGADVVHTWLAQEGQGYEERSSLRNQEVDPTWEIGKLDPTQVADRLATREPMIEHDHRAASYFARQPEPPVVSLGVVPMRAREKLIGWIAVSSQTPKKRFDEGQRKLLSIIASRAAAAIENSRLYEDLQATFQQTIQSLAKTIDKMDRYTAGHSERVANYATRLAEWLGLDAAQVEIVRQAALMHDIGKVGCVMNLNKPGRLTPAEYEAFKLHTRYGKEILDPVKFLEPVVPGVHLHHERWDGRGYPLGLTAQEIPIVARIISVADTYDAMTSDRAYRRALPHEVTVDEIERCAGTQFDPEVAATFLQHIEVLREERRERGEPIPE